MPKPRLVAGLAALALGAAVAAPATAQTSVGVSLSNPGSSRTLYVENMAGQALSSLDFGTGRSMPFRVRVVDDAFSRQAFSVSASMTNLYKNNGGSPDTSQPSIPSSQVSLGSQVMPLDVLSVKAAVQPLVNTVSTITDGVICGLLKLPLLSNVCTITQTGLTGALQVLDVPVDLSSLGNLPLLPQANETGNFAWAEYGAGTAGAGDTAGKAAETAAGQTASHRTVVSGAPITTAAVLNPLTTALNALPQSTLIPTATLVNALRSALGAVWDLLSATQITTVVNSTVATVQSVIPSQILNQSGTYMSMPTLNVDTTGAAAGDYLGTLVVTALQ